MKYVIVSIVLCLSTTVFSQGFITGIEQDDLGVLFGNQCIVTLASGEEVTGKLSGGSMINGYLNGITIKQENGEKSKFKPEDVSRLAIKASKLAKLAMLAEST